jgi:plasmid stabilization system protein ParE
VTRYRIYVLARARRDYAAALAWWRLNRLAAPRMLRDEMRAAKKLLSALPEAGALDVTRKGEIRRLLLRGSNYFVYYRVDGEQRRIEILSIWHAQRLPPAP